MDLNYLLCYICCIPPNHNMHCNTAGSFQKNHQGMFVWHLEAEIFALALASLTGSEQKMQIKFILYKISQ